MKLSKLYTRKEIKAIREKLIAVQGNLCAFCHRPPKKMALNVDHDHVTGKVRGLLCFRCNKHLVGAHNVDTARKLVAYLEAYV